MFLKITIAPSQCVFIRQTFNKNAPRLNLISILCFAETFYCFTARKGNMDNKLKLELFGISGKINILEQIGSCFGTHVEMASHLGISLVMLSTIVKNHEETERWYSHVDLSPSSGNH
jgi:hypothetical protein